MASGIDRKQHTRARTHDSVRTSSWDEEKICREDNGCAKSLTVYPVQLFADIMIQKLCQQRGNIATTRGSEYNMY